MARLIVRISLDDDNGTDTTRARDALESRGVKVIGTGVREGYGELDHLTAALRELLDVIDDPVSGSKLDHLWVYLDKTHG